MAANPEQWAAQFKEKMGPEWAAQFAAEGGGQEEWMQEYTKMQEALGEQDWAGDFLQQQNKYTHSEDNPFLVDPNAFDKGLEHFMEGNLPQAILAFEADVQQNEQHADGWKYLGLTHAEADEDLKAIASLSRCIEIPGSEHDPEALMSLGVSYANELQSDRSVEHLQKYITGNPEFAGIVPGEGMNAHDITVKMFNQAAEMHPENASVHAALGVLYNLSHEYDLAAECFRRSLDINPKDYTLWNKLGATLANSTNQPQGSEDALEAYHNALEIKPNFARALSNLGISFSNRGIFQDAASCYLRVLNMNPQANHIWSYLRGCFTQMNRYDLVEKLQARDVQMFAEEFEFQ